MGKPKFTVASTRSSGTPAVAACFSERMRELSPVEQARVNELINHLASIRGDERAALQEKIDRLCYVYKG